MKGLSFGYKIIFLFNNIFAILLVVSYITSYISPLKYPVTGVVNFTIPFLWVINALFALLWLIKLKKQILLSLLVMGLGWFMMKNLFVLSNNVQYAEKGVKVMSYNVMQFYNLKDKKKSTINNIDDFIKTEDPHILCFQEYVERENQIGIKYPFGIVNNDSSQLKTAIYSKYPIIKAKHFHFGLSNNSAVMADIAIKEDTIRVFSVHFESLNLRQDFDHINKEPKDKLLKRLSKTFRRQIEQFHSIEEDIATAPYPVIVCADMNNTAVSYLYRQFKNLDLKDAFVESGQFYGSTFKFNILPVRIDMIFIDTKLKPVQFFNYEKDYSDHRPVMTEIAL